MQKKTTTTITDKQYKLVSKTAPLSYVLQSRNAKRYPLAWYDEENNINKTLRYAVNQKSPFESEQDGNFILEPIVFVDGFLNVAKTNPVLQQFLHYHPQNGVVFAEVDKSRDAADDVDNINIELDALLQARQLSLEQLEIVSRVMFGRNPSVISTAELKRDVLIYAKKDPRGFLNIIEDPMLQLQSNVHVFFERGILTFRNGQKEVWFNMPTNKKKMLSVPFGDDPYETVTLFLKSDDGIEILKALEISLK